MIQVSHHGFGSGNEPEFRPQAPDDSLRQVIEQHDPFWQINPVTGLSFDYLNEFHATRMTLTFLEFLSSADRNAESIETAEQLLRAIRTIKTYDDYLLEKTAQWNVGAEPAHRIDSPAIFVNDANQQGIRRLNELTELMRLTVSENEQGRPQFRLREFVEHTVEAVRIVAGPERTVAYRTLPLHDLKNVLERAGVDVPDVDG